MFEKLRPEHPRLLALEEDMARTRKMIEQDSVGF